MTDYEGTWVESKPGKWKKVRGSGLRAQKACAKNGPTKLVGSGSYGSLPVSSAESLVATWTNYARYAEEAEHVQADNAWRAKAEAYRSCAEQLRREIAAAPVRQPEENNAICHGRAQP